MAFTPLLPEIPPLVVPARVGSPAGPTRAEARGRGWRRGTAGFYVPSWIVECVEQRIIEQGHRLTRGAVTGWASLRLHRVAYFDGLARDGLTELPVPLLENGERLTPSPSRIIGRARVAPGEIEIFRDAMRCTTVPRALLDVVRMELDEREAVVAIDMTVAAGVITLADFAAYLGQHRGERGVARASRLLPRCEPRSRSPQESRMRQIWELDAGWGRPLCNVNVCDESGAFIGRPDLLDPDRAVAGEYDGAEHRSKSRHRTDVTRESGFRRAGLEVVTAVGDSLMDIPTLVARLHEAEERARRSKRTFLWRK